MRPESITYGGEEVRYLIPTALCYQHEIKDWLIGQPALDYAEKTGERVYRNLLDHVFLGGSCLINGQEYNYTQLLAIFIGKIIELTQTATSLMGIENITVNLRRVTQEIQAVMKEVFRMLRFPEEKVKLQTCAESFAYFVLNEDPSIWEKGTILYDFDQDGFYEKVLTVNGSPEGELVYVSDRSHSAAFSMRDMGNEFLMDQMDDKLFRLYSEIASEGRISSVYFTGEGFRDLWFERTLRMISEQKRAFKGNNIYAKGACLSGLFRADDERQDYSIICAGRTKATISVEVRHKGEPILLNLSKAPKDWFDSGMKMDFILDEPGPIRVYVSSLISSYRNSFDLDLSGLPQRPKKATRIEIELKYFSENSCEITVRDKGFGEMYPASSFTVSRQLDLSGEI